MPAFGVYPIADALNPGDEISSSYEGRHITVLESDLIHPVHVPADVLVHKGDPVVFGATGLQAVGVAFKTAIANSDLIAIDTEGIWNLDVDPTDDLGNSNVAGGDLLYINVTNAVISKIRNTATQIPFGYALGIITAPGIEAIAVKVHFDPSLDTNDIMFKTVTSGAYSYGKQWRGLLEAGESTGVAGYFVAEVDGVQTGGIYGWGAWTEPQAGFVGSAGLLVAGEFGIWDGLGGDISANWVVLLQLQGILSQAPTRLDIFRVNIAQPVPIVTHCVIAAANPNSVGFVADAVDNAGANKLGNVPLFDIVGVGVCYVEVFSS